MLLPYSFPPWLMRGIIKGGMSMQKLVFGCEKVAKVQNTTIDITHYNSSETYKLPIRVYKPEGEGPFPVVVFYHGGGWVLCSLDTHDHICRFICNKANAVVINVDYRLAPEFRFPIGFEDAYAATTYIHAHAKDFGGDASRMCLAGDSAGGNFSASISQLVRERQGPRFLCLVLIYPSTDLRPVSHYESFDGKCIGLSLQDSQWFCKQYLNSPEDAEDIRASPIVCNDLTNLPPTLIITAEHDRIRDHGEQYGRLLERAGVPVVIKRYDHAGHAFLSVGGKDIMTESLGYISEWLRNMFNNAHVSNPEDANTLTESDVKAATSLAERVADVEVGPA